ncbi:hypothetical protein GAP52_055A [Cronobacter phage vB_CsaP_GAP52]|uniref:HNH endonuclease n=1 Tax=Cronobacter phage vB_CsaP_GAP52 TaxID=1141137 RepID=K4F7F8_9CAUD|nr:HNH endonuclease [Cronobacter phage vB_CsaP_GAP52]AFC22048.1 hypothetical protein GAP52_055A [Cronobacter phage vB_CsaP_GAP52]
MMAITINSLVPCGLSVKVRKPVKQCETCGGEFEARTNNQRFCCESCRYKSHANTAKRISQIKDRRQRQLKFIRRVKTFYGCSLCGYRGHYAALQFDHLDPSLKSFEMGQAHTRGMPQIKEEMRKCRILCANCHSIHTFNQNQGG